MLAMGYGWPVVVALLLLAAVLLVQSDLQIQGPLDKPSGLCATFVLSLGLSYNCDEYVVRSLYLAL